MPGTTQIGRPGFRIDQCLHGQRAIVCRYTCCTSIPQKVHRYRKCSFMQGSIVIDHEIELKFVASLFDKRRTDQSTSVLAHEINDLGSDVSGGSNKIAFVLTI